MTPVALVTGSSRGIGRGIAFCLARAGYDILINYTRNRQAARETADGVRQRGRRAEICRADIASSREGTRLVDVTLDTFGRLDLLVNNAGIAPGVRADLLAATPGQLRRGPGHQPERPLFPHTVRGEPHGRTPEKGNR